MPTDELEYLYTVRHVRTVAFRVYEDADGETVTRVKSGSRTHNQRRVVEELADAGEWRPPDESAEVEADA